MPDSLSPTMRSALITWLKYGWGSKPYGVSRGTALALCRRGLAMAYRERVTATEFFRDGEWTNRSPRREKPRWSYTFALSGEGVRLARQLTEAAD